MTTEGNGLLSLLRRIIARNRVSQNSLEERANIASSEKPVERAPTPEEVYAAEREASRLEEERVNGIRMHRYGELVQIMQGVTSRNLLVVEDNPEYLTQLQEIFAKRDTNRLTINVTYASTLEAALREIECGAYDGVMSDVFFPKSEGRQEELNGTKVAQAAFDRGLPVVLVTSTYHHDGKTGPANHWAREHNFNLIDTYKGYEGKNFLGALLALGYAVESGSDMEISPEGYKGLNWPEDSPVPISSGKIYRLDLIIGMANQIDSNRREGTLKQELERQFSNIPLLGEVAKRYCGGLFPELYS